MRQLISRRRAIAVGIASVAGGFAGYGYLAEPRWLEVRAVKINLTQTLSNPVRILHLSDLHYSAFVSLSFIEEAIQVGLSLTPEIVCLTGDFITAGDERDLKRYMGVLGQLSAAVPTFAVLGNHDGGAWSRPRGGYQSTAEIAGLLDGAGITLLHNRSVSIRTKGGQLLFTGTGDLWAGDFAPSEAFDKAKSKASVVTILLAHNPDTKDLADNVPWDLMLSGHTHGGQIVIPFLGAPFAPVQDRRYIAGLNKWKGRWIYTTRGIGNLYGVRLNCRPEVSILDLL